MKARQQIAVTTFSQNTVEWFTPEWLLDEARRVLGGFDLDPASCVAAQERVRAKVFYTAEDDGLRHYWGGRVWLNPPYGSSGGRSSQGIWAQRLVEEYETGLVQEALLLVRSALGYEWFEQLFEHWPVCFLRKLLTFTSADGLPAGRSKQGAALFYFGENCLTFYRVFSDHGRIIMPVGRQCATLIA